MRGQRQGVRPTKVNTKIEENNDEKEGDEKQVKVKHHDIYINVYKPKETMYTDQTGNFLFVSIWGNKYIMVLVYVESGSIWDEAMKNETEGETIQARRRALLLMKLCGIAPKRQILDNEASNLYKQEIRDMNTTSQLVPPNDHRRNIA